MSDRPPAFTRFGKTRRKTLELVEDLTQEQIDFSPGKGKWSTSEVLDHLTRTDRIFRDEYDELLKRWKKDRGPVSLFRTLSDAGFSLPLVPDAMLPLFDLPTAMAAILVPRPIRQAIFANRAVPAQAPDRIRPKKGRTADDLRRELREFHDYLEGLVDDNPEVEWERLRYYNPICGFTNVPGVLSFTASHEKRHQEQIREIKADDGFPET